MRFFGSYEEGSDPKILIIEDFVWPESPGILANQMWIVLTSSDDLGLGIPHDLLTKHTPNILVILPIYQHRIIIKNGL